MKNKFWLTKVYDFFVFVLILCFVRKWSRNCDLCLNLRSHSSQLKGFSPVWIRICDLSVCRCRNLEKYLLNLLRFLVAQRHPCLRAPKCQISPWKYDIKWIWSEPGAANLAWVWFLASVNEDMCSKMGHLNKASATCITFVWFFSTVNSQMGFQVCWSIKLSVTDWAFIWFVA